MIKTVNTAICDGGKAPAGRRHRVSENFRLRPKSCVVVG